VRFDPATAVGTQQPATNDKRSKTMLLRDEIRRLSDTLLRYEEADSRNALRDMRLSLEAAVKDLEDARSEVAEFKRFFAAKSLELKQARAQIARGKRMTVACAPQEKNRIVCLEAELADCRTLLSDSTECITRVETMNSSLRTDLQSVQDKLAV
jgi:predicted  nucleic acid-binding Zn-ribbon protein